MNVNNLFKLYFSSTQIFVQCNFAYLLSSGKALILDQILRRHEAWNVHRLVSLPHRSMYGLLSSTFTSICFRQSARYEFSESTFESFPVNPPKTC